jgi:hypothetical protein
MLTTSLGSHAVSMESYIRHLYVSIANNFSAPSGMSFLNEYLVKRICTLFVEQTRWEDIRFSPAELTLTTPTKRNAHLVMTIFHFNVLFVVKHFIENREKYICVIHFIK